MHVPHDEAARFWDGEVAAPTHSNWMEPPAVRRYINEQISGDPDVWPLYWLRDTVRPPRFRRALSIGCGTGALERDLITMGLADAVDACDVSVASVRVAAETARRDGLAIRYFVADFNRPALPESTYDAVFFHQSLHHVAKLEKMLRAVLRTLTPDGLVYLEEFIGPSRSDWNERNLEPYQRIYARFDESIRWFDYMPFPVAWDDPSEAVRSSEIVGQLGRGFVIDRFRGYGGNVLSVMFPAVLPGSFTDADVDALIDEDRAAVARDGRHFHAVIVARPRRGLQRKLAMLRYFVEPKLRTVIRAIVRAVRPWRSPLTRPRRQLHPASAGRQRTD